MLSGFMWEYQTLRHLRRNWRSWWHQRHKTSVGQVRYVGSGFSATGGRKICQICTSVSSHQRWSRLTRRCLTRVSSNLVSPESHQILSNRHILTCTSTATKYSVQYRITGQLTLVRYRSVHHDQLTFDNLKLWHHRGDNYKMVLINCDNLLMKSYVENMVVTNVSGVVGGGKIWWHWVTAVRSSMSSSPCTGAFNDLKVTIFPWRDMLHIIGEKIAVTNVWW